MNDGLEQWLLRWHRAGVPTIPLWPNSKKPVRDAWNTEAPADQWQAVGTDFSGNIGVLGGHGLAVIDADSAQTTANVNLWFSERDKQVPVVRSRHNRHFYVPVQGMPADFTSSNLAPSVGPGSLRGNVNICAPCSVVDGHRYTFVRGGPEELTGVPFIHWRQMTWLVAPETPGERLTQPPIPLLHREMPANTAGLLAVLRDAPRSAPIGKYLTRSEAEAGVMAALICAGWSLDEIGRTFHQAQPGHYHDYGPRHRERYLLRTYQNVLTFLACTPARQTAVELWHQAQRAPWPGATGIYDRDTYLALLAVAWQFDTLTVAPGRRTLSEYTAISQQACSNALARLVRDGLLDQLQDDGDSACYQVNAARASYLATNHSPSGSIGNVPVDDDREAPGVQSLDVAPVGGAVGVAELWSSEHLKRSAGAVYGLLSEAPLSAVELAQRSGKSERTVNRALVRLRDAGLAERVPAGWVRGRADVLDLAVVRGAVLAAKVRRARHEREREARQAELCNYL